MCIESSDNIEECPTVGAENVPKEDGEDSDDDAGDINEDIDDALDEGYVWLWRIKCDSLCSGVVK